MIADREQDANSKQKIEEHSSRSIAGSNSDSRVLFIAYVANPQNGSESGSGWALLNYYLERGFQVSILCGPGVVDNISEKLKPFSNQWEFVQIPAGKFGNQFTRVLPYSLQVRNIIWNLQISYYWKEIVGKRKFTFSHYATFAGDWNICAPLFRRSFPVLWGPVGGTQKIPKVLYSALGFRGLLNELARSIVTVPLRQLNRLLAFSNRNITILCLNDAVQKAFSTRRSQSPLISNIVLPCLGSSDYWKDCQSNYYFGAGRLIALKNWKLAIRALAKIDDSSLLLIAGDGSEKKALQKLATKLKISERVIFLGTLTQLECINLMIHSKGVVFPSLRDSEGWALAEAAHYGVPAIALNTPGSRAISYFSEIDLVPISRKKIVEDFARLMHHPVPPRLCGAFCKCRLAERLSDFVPTSR